MRNFCILLALISAALAAGCAAPRRPAGEENVAGPTRVTAAHQAGPWQQYLAVMTDRERIEFLNILDDSDRRRWVRVNGIDVRAELAGKLARGLTLETAKRRLSDKLDVEEARGDSVMLYYSRFNGDTRTNYYLKFESNQLVNWNTYTVAQQDRTMELMTFEAEIMRRLDIALKPGMGPETIRKMAFIANERLNEVLQGRHRDRLKDDNVKDRTDYKRRVVVDYDEKTGQYTVTVPEKPGEGQEVIVHRPSTDNYIVEEQVIMTTAQADFLGWFAKEPQRKIIHRPFETHQFLLPYKSKRGVKETVVVEFSFRDGLLEQWFVYHDE